MSLAAAIAERDWPTALRAALEIWRATRDPLAARLIHRISARLILVQPALNSELHAWWMRHASPYDPIVATTLLGHVVVRLRGRDVIWADVAKRWPGAKIVGLIADGDSRLDPTNWIERIAAIETWPDDPRLSSVLASWLTGPIGHDLFTRHPRAVDLLCEQLARLADVRIRPRIEAYRRQIVNALERAAVDALVEELDVVQPRSAGLQPLLAILDEPTPIEELWQRAAHDRDARSVLGDALVAIGETRGTFIALSVPPEPSRAHRAARILSKEWERWLGPDLASIARYDGTEFRDGMLEVLRAGQPSTPIWAWSAAAGHRELRTVHTVRAGTIRDHREYAQFLSSLEQLRTLERVVLATLAELAAIGARLPITHMTLERAHAPLPDPVQIVELALEIAPQLRELRLPPELASDEVVAAYPDLVSVIAR